MTFRSVRSTGSDELARLYAQHSRPLLRLAALLVPDIAVAQEIVYEAFAAFDCGRRRPRRRDDAFMYLLRTVVHHARETAPGAGTAEPGGMETVSAVLSALHALPGRQREALVLRYYGQLSDERAAMVMGIRLTELQADVARGMAALRSALASSGERLSLSCDARRGKLAATARS